jgi:hypothetical protein
VIKEETGMKTESVGDKNKAKRTIIKYIKIPALQQVPTVHDAAVSLSRDKSYLILGRSCKLRASTKFLRALGAQIGCFELFVVHFAPSRQMLG